MSKITSKFDKVLNTSQFHGKMVHEPDSSTETYQNSADITTPPADYIGNYQRNRGIGSDQYQNSKIYIVGSGIAGLSAACHFSLQTPLAVLTQSVSSSSLSLSGIAPTRGLLLTL